MSLLKKFTKSIASAYYCVCEKLQPSRITNVKDIPIIINNFNRVASLKLLIARLEKAGCTNIHILDNDSTYPPLLEYYKTCPYHVHYLGANLGFKALWKSPLCKEFCNDYYVYTDSDVVPDESCPDDFMQKFLDVLKKHPLARKVGFSLHIDDLPDCYEFKDKVLAKESPYFDKFIEQEGIYRAPIDTTFALYRPRVGLSRSRFVEAYRTASPYQAHHLPWYSNTTQPTDEDLYYARSTTHATDWTSQQKARFDAQK